MVTIGSIGSSRGVVFFSEKKRSVTSRLYGEMASH